MMPLALSGYASVYAAVVIIVCNERFLFVFPPIQRLKAIEKPLKYYIYEMPHGFLNFAALLPGATAPIRDSTDFINSIFSETVNKPAPSLDHDSVN
jgi:hypothetical protein